MSGKNRIVAVCALLMVMPSRVAGFTITSGDTELGVPGAYECEINDDILVSCSAIETLTTEDSSMLLLNEFGLTGIEPDCFIALNSSGIAILMLERNLLTEIKNGTFVPLRLTLKALSLGHNFIVTLESNYLGSAPLLDTLFLDNNRLNESPSWLFDELESINSVFLHQNGMTILWVDMFNRSMVSVTFKGNEIYSESLDPFDAWGDDNDPVLNFPARLALAIQASSKQARRNNHLVNFALTNVSCVDPNITLIGEPSLTDPDKYCCGPGCVTPSPTVSPTVSPTETSWSPTDAPTTSAPTPPTVSPTETSWATYSPSPSPTDAPTTSAPTAPTTDRGYNHTHEHTHGHTGKGKKGKKGKKGEKDDTHNHTHHHTGETAQTHGHSVGKKGKKGKKGHPHGLTDDHDHQVHDHEHDETEHHGKTGHHNHSGKKVSLDKKGKRKEDRMNKKGNKKGKKGKQVHVNLSEILNRTYTKKKGEKDHKGRKNKKDKRSRKHNKGKKHGSSLISDETSSDQNDASTVAFLGIGCGVLVVAVVGTTFIIKKAKRDSFKPEAESEGGDGKSAESDIFDQAASRAASIN